MAILHKSKQFSYIILLFWFSLGVWLAIAGVALQIVCRLLDLPRPTVISLTWLCFLLMWVTKGSFKILYIQLTGKTSFEERQFGGRDQMRVPLQTNVLPKHCIPSVNHSAQKEAPYLSIWGLFKVKSIFYYSCIFEACAYIHFIRVHRYAQVCNISCTRRIGFAVKADFRHL